MRVKQVVVSAMSAPPTRSNCWVVGAEDDDVMMVDAVGVWRMVGNDE